jgi:sigma-B regulation protein RsbU (phosphoserine phosphatase)
VLGHDLRNPLASIDAGVRMLQKEALGGRGPAIVRLVQSSVSRMAELIDNVLDFARGRLGGGLKLDLNAEARLRPVLEQVVAELRSAWPERAIETALVIDQPVNCDRARIAQLLSNLLGNALTHGAPDAPARVSASSDGDVFVLSVENKGEPIPPGTVDRLFQPFFRGAGRTGQQGLGLGLYIASEIARAHGGTLTVASSPERTRFTLRMPRGDAGA